MQARCYFVFERSPRNDCRMATSLMEKRAPADHSINVADRIDAFVRADRKWIVACCCIYAAVRILIFVAAFPLFNDIDEQDHYEMIYRYAHGYAPESTLPMADHVIARLATLYGSPEYYHSRETLRSVHRDVPIAVLPPALKEYHYRLVLAFWESTQEVEAQSPPVYYAVAGMWNKFGAMLGAKDWVLAYWTRSLNAIVYGIFVWISFLFVQELYPAHDFLCVAVPIFLAIFRQDFFFALNRDVLSPLFGALALLVLFRAMREGSGVYGNLVGGGLLVGLAFVTDISNFVYAGLLGVVFYQRYCSTKTFSNSKRDLRGIAASALVAMLFPVLWMAHNTVVTGDLTASRMKTAYLGWTLKAWPEIWHHPILSVSGFHYFFNGLTVEFWRGESGWRGLP